MSGSNPYGTSAYTYSGAFIAGILARAEAETAEFTSVQTGFRALITQGADSGAANAYVVTTASGGGPAANYVDGDIVEFKVANANTGGCTINVNSVGVVALTQYNSQALAAGALVVNTWVRVIYNSSFSCFTLLAPTVQVISSSTISGAAPTNKVGLTAAGGVSLAVVPIDATYAIDQSIVPTWTGAHTFSGGATFSAAPTFSAGLGTITGPASTYAAILDGASGAGLSFGVRIDAGTNSSDVCVLFRNQAGSAFFKIDGAGSVTTGANTAQGAGTINATGLYVAGVAVSTVTAANPAGTVGLSTVNGVATTFLRSDGAPPLSQAIAPTWTAAHIFTPGSAVTAVTINAAINAIGMIINGATNTSNHYLLEIISAQGQGFSSGLLIEAGTTSADDALYVENATGTAYFVVQGDGQVYVTVPGADSSGPTGTVQVGYLDAPQVAISASLSTPVTYRGKTILLNGGSGQTLTLAASTFGVGVTFTVINTSGNSWSIAAAGGATLTWLPSITTGTRTLAYGGVVTIYVAAANNFQIWGFGLT